MDIQYFILSLELSGKKIEFILNGVSNEQAIWKPHQDKWSILEVINHLYDEEKDDFRKRLDITLNKPDEKWPGIDPEKWAIEREYNKRNFDQSLQNFIKEREKSLQWLRILSDPNLNKRYDHPLIGSLAAGDLLASWACHDYLHLRQLAFLQGQYLNLPAQPFSTRYASP
jgi:hypothetical protein